MDSGTRLRPLTNTIPKCMITIHGKPILYHWFCLLRKHGIYDVLINLHHLAGVVREYVNEFNSSYPDFRITLSYEEELLGSAGTIRANAQWVKDERDFLIAYADNLTDVNLTKLIKFHRSKDTVLTMGLFRSDYPEECGIATMDDCCLVIDFTEKPDEPRSNMANAGIYVAGPSLPQYIPKGFADLGYDVLPKLVGKMYGCPIEGYLRDIGTIDSYEKARREWRMRKAI